SSFRLCLEVFLALPEIHITSDLLEFVLFGGLPPQSVTTDPRHVSGFLTRADMCMREDPIEEPEPLVGHEDQFDAHPNPQPGNLNDWENEDVDIEEDDDAEIIFPYEVQGDQTPPPRDESSDSDSEPKAEEVDDEPG
nr:hypothetical protein [Tanacetum cinerariifolium]